MKTIYCLGLCPYCDNHGYIYPIRDGNKITFICDESYHRFETLKDVSRGKLIPIIDLRDDYMPLEEFLEEMPELENKVFIFENGIWVNMKNKQKRLFK